MNILITTWSLAHFTGAELYARDLALALQRRGHYVAIYTIFEGRLAQTARAAGIAVITNLRDSPFVPDVIHGHHQPALLDALLRFPRTPALFVIHDADAARDAPIAFPRIRRFVAVDQRCLARIVEDEAGIPVEQCRLIPNFVDLDRFRPRPLLPERPERALVFSSYATHATHLPAVLAACERLGLPVDVVGRGVGNLIETPENVLGRYDLVFAKARCAIEAMAVGAAVVLCDFRGLGPMVTSGDFDRLRSMNFGAGTLVSPLEPDLIAREVAKYDRRDAALVCARIRSEAGLTRVADQLLDLYGEILADPATERAMIQADDTLLLRLNARWASARRKETLVDLMRRVRRIPLIGPIAYEAWRAGERAIKPGSAPGR